MNGLIVQYGFVVFFQMKFKLNSVKSYLKKACFGVEVNVFILLKINVFKEKCNSIHKIRISRCITKSVNWEMNL